ncbi:MAG TPA: hypothetical protein VGE45_06645 [Chloroflexia bacterium]
MLDTTRTCLTWLAGTNVDGLGIAEQPIIASLITVQPEAFNANRQDHFDNHPQEVNLHTNHAPGQRPGRIRDTTPRSQL